MTTAAATKPTSKPRSQQEITWAHGATTANFAELMLSGTIDGKPISMKTVAALKGAHDALCWASGCSSEPNEGSFDKMLNRAAARYGIPRPAEQNSTRADETKNAQAPDARRSADEIREVVATLKKTIESIRSSDMTRGLIDGKIMEPAELEGCLNRLIGVLNWVTNERTPLSAEFETFLRVNSLLNQLKGAAR